MKRDIFETEDGTQFVGWLFILRKIRIARLTADVIVGERDE